MYVNRCEKWKAMWPTLLYVPRELHPQDAFPEPEFWVNCKTESRRDKPKSDEHFQKKPRSRQRTALHHQADGLQPARSRTGQLPLGQEHRAQGRVASPSLRGASAPDVTVSPLSVILTYHTEPRLERPRAHYQPQQEKESKQQRASPCLSEWAPLFEIRRYSQQGVLWWLAGESASLKPGERSCERPLRPLQETQTLPS